MEFNNYYIAAQLPKEGYAAVGRDMGVPLNCSAAFSIEAWVRVSERENGIDILSCKNYFRFGIDSEKLTLAVAGLPTISRATTSAINILDWHHVAVTYNMQHVRLYIDGECVGTSSFSGQGSGTPHEFVVGSQLQGRMRSVRIYKRGLTGDEVNSSMFGAIDDAGLVTDLDFTCNPPIDKKSSQRTITLTGGAEIRTIYPSLKLSGTAYATPSNKAKINPGGNNFDPYTVHALFRIDSLKGRQTIFANALPQSNAGMALYVEYDIEENKMVVKSLRGSSLDDEMTLVSKSTIALGEWVSVTTTYDGEWLRIYINGNKDIEARFGPILISTISGNPIIGGRFHGGAVMASNTLQGNLSRLEVWSKALSDEEIKGYIDKLPELDSPMLHCMFDFSVFHVLNEADNAPVYMCGGAVISEYTEATKEGNKERQVLQNCMTYAVDSALLQSFREEVEFSLTEERKFHVTQHAHEEEFFIAVHYPQYSYVAYRCRREHIDECLLRKITLIFAIVAGVTDVLLGAKPVLTDQAVAFIAKHILPLPQITTTLSAGAEITAKDLFNIGVVLVSKGLLKELMKMILVVSFWCLLRLALRLILSFLGVGAADMIISLLATTVVVTTLIVKYIKKCLPFPPVALHGIKFNHDLTQHQTAALNIRKNAATAITIPEWRPMQQSPVAYAIRQVPPAGVVIHVKFKTLTPLPTTVRIRAHSRGGSILGDVAQFDCLFILGSSNYIPIPVAFNGAAIGVGVGHASWNWEYYDDKQLRWVGMGSSINATYLTLNTPNLPWTQDHNLASQTLPSEEALQLGSAWAVGTNNVAQLPRQLAVGFHNDNRFKYGGLSIYTSSINNNAGLSFRINLFLTECSNQNRVYIECSDCASIVVFFTKLFGGTANAVFINKTNAEVDTTYIQAIGSNQWESHQFSYHVFNILGNVFQNNAQVIDACVKLNGDNNPWQQPAVAPAVSFMPGALGNLMDYTTQAAPVVEGVPYAVQNSYRERFLINTVAAKNLNSIIFTNFQIDLR
jgi:hypothetical protein